MMTRWQNDRVTKWQYEKKADDSLTRWQDNDKITGWQDDYKMMTRLLDDKMTGWGDDNWRCNIKI